MDASSGRRDAAREARDAARLALVPIGVALVLGLLLLPRRAAPEAVPLPVPDAAALDRASAQDRELAARWQGPEGTLPAPVRALGSAMRAFHTLEAHDEPRASVMSESRQAVDAALVDVLGADPRSAAGSLLALRAVQLEAFLGEVRRFESSGVESEELGALAGSFLRSLDAEGWRHGRVLAPDETVLAVMFKHMWDGFLGLEDRAELRPSIDEERALYAFYLSHAHPTKAMREALDAARRGAASATTCTAIEEAERAGTEAYRLEHIARLAAIDPAYPADYARGVVEFRRGQYAASAASFEAWLHDHPEGPFALRAGNFLRAAAAADRGE